MFKSFWQTEQPVQDDQQKNIQLKSRVKELIDVARASRLPAEHLYEQILSVVQQVCRRESISADPHLQRYVTNSLVEEIQGISPISELWNDPEVTQLFARGTEYLRIKRNGQWECTGKHFSHNLQLQHLICNFARQVGCSWKADVPELAGQLSDGTHFHAGRSHSNLVLSLKKQINHYCTMDDWVSNNSLTWEMAEFLITAMEQRCNIVITGTESASLALLLQALYQACDKPQWLVAWIDAADAAQRHVNTVQLTSTKSSEIANRIVQARSWNADYLFCNLLPVSAVKELIDTMQTEIGCVVSLPLKNNRSLFDRLVWMLACENINPCHSSLCNLVSASVDLVVEVQSGANHNPVVLRIAEVRSDSRLGIAEHEIFVQRPVSQTEQNLFYATGTVPHSLDSVFTEDFFLPRELSELPVVPSEETEYKTASEEQMPIDL